MKFFLRATILFILLALLFTLVFTFPAWGNATLYRGSQPLGDVATTKGPTSGLWVSIEEAGALLGFTSSRSGEELLLMRGDTRLRVVLDAVAAWRDVYLVPLYAAPFEKSGKFWLDSSSAVALFQKAAGTGEQSRLRFDRADRSMNIVPEAQSTALSSSSQASASPAEILVSDPTPAGPSQAMKAATTQEKFEIFRPDSNTSTRPSRSSQNRGEIQRLRWSTTRERIRAVIDASDDADPEVRMKDGSIHAAFASIVKNPEGLPPPYENVRVELKNLASGVELVFSSNSVRVEKMILDAPRRIVFDFFFKTQAEIRATAIQPQTQPKQEQQASQAPVLSGPVSKPAKKGRKIVVVDPGHGGKDPGAVANGIREKDTNLAIGLALEKALKAKGLDVVMTRRTDVYLKLQERTDIANKENADVFVSVHANALPSAKKASGFEIYLMALPTDKDALNLAKIENREYIEEKTGNSKVEDQRTELLLRILGDMQQNNKISESTGLAEALFAAGRQSGIPMKRVAQAPFFVLRGAGMPAVLLETGFVTNATEAKLLAHSGYQQRIAEAMAVGIEKYLK